MKDNKDPLDELVKDTSKMIESDLALTPIELTGIMACEKEIILKKLENFGKSISKEFKINKFFFFGSRVRGDYHKDSDIDLLIISKDFEKLKPFKRAVKLYDYWKLNYPVDFLCLTPSEFLKRKKQIGTIQQAVKEGIRIKAG